MAKLVSKRAQKIIINRVLFFVFFSIYYCILDGADVNKQFIKMNFKMHFKTSDPVENKFVTKNPFNGEPMVFTMDCKVQHVPASIIHHTFSVSISALLAINV